MGKSPGPSLGKWLRRAACRLPLPQRLHNLIFVSVALLRTASTTTCLWRAELESFVLRGRQPGAGRAG